MNPIQFRNDLRILTMQGLKTMTRRWSGLDSVQKPEWKYVGPDEKPGHHIFKHEIYGNITRLWCKYGHVGSTCYIDEPARIAKSQKWVKAATECTPEEFENSRNAIKLYPPQNPFLLEITEVYAQRLFEMSQEDAIKEGLVYVTDFLEPYVIADAFSTIKIPEPKSIMFHLLDEMKGRTFVESNPMLWVIKFKIKDNTRALRAAY